MTHVSTSALQPGVETRPHEQHHVKTIAKPILKQTAHTGGCGECQTSCQSACKTSCTVANQVCEK